MVIYTTHVLKLPIKQLEFKQAQIHKGIMVACLEIKHKHG